MQLKTLCKLFCVVVAFGFCAISIFLSHWDYNLHHDGFVLTQSPDGEAPTGLRRATVSHLWGSFQAHRQLSFSEIIWCFCEKVIDWLSGTQKENSFRSALYWPLQYGFRPVTGSFPSANIFHSYTQANWLFSVLWFPIPS